MIPQKRVKASGPKNAKIAIVGMAPAKEECLEGRPFVGPSGRILNESLASFGVSRKDVFVTNILEFPLYGKNVFDVSEAQRAPEVARLRAELEEVHPNVIIPLGDEPLQILCGKKGILKWRGSIIPCTLVEGLKCVPSVHPAWIIRGMWKWLPVFMSIDIARAIVQSKFPEILYEPKHCITGPSFSTVINFIEECHQYEYLSVDIECYGFTKYGMGEISCVGIGAKRTALCIPFVRSGKIPYWTEREE